MLKSISSLIPILCGFCQTVMGEEPARLTLPEDSSLISALVAEGVQIYEAMDDSSGGFRWVLKGPEAELKNLSGERVAKHFAGPSWEAEDGSQIVGALPPVSTVKDGANIPWLVLAVKSRKGTGLLENVTSVARISTQGGAPPSDPPKSLSETVQVKYRAIYLFFQKR